VSNWALNEMKIVPNPHFSLFFPHFALKWKK
jgi:hypothetical protein